MIFTFAALSSFLTQLSIFLILCMRSEKSLNTKTNLYGLSDLICYAVLKSDLIRLSPSPWFEILSALQLAKTTSQMLSVNQPSVSQQAHDLSTHAPNCLNPPHPKRRFISPVGTELECHELSVQPRVVHGPETLSQTLCSSKLPHK